MSPDGTKLSLDIREGSGSVWIWDLKRESLLHLADDAQYGVWSTDSQSVFVNERVATAMEIYRLRADGTGQPEQVTDNSKVGTPFPNAVTPDGKQVVFRAATGAKNNLYAVTIGDRAAHAVLATEHDEPNATLSPDGKWMAFASDLSGKSEIYVRPFPDTNPAQFSVSTTGGFKPVWSPTGREIFYFSLDQKMMAVPVDTSRGFTAGKPVTLFDARPYFTGGVGRNFDVSADGKRFILIKPLDTGGAATPITVVLDWAEELRALFKGNRR